MKWPEIRRLRKLRQMNDLLPSLDSEHNSFLLTEGIGNVNLDDYIFVHPWSFLHFHMNSVVSIKKFALSPEDCLHPRHWSASFLPHLFPRLSLPSPLKNQINFLSFQENCSMEFITNHMLLVMTIIFAVVASGKCTIKSWPGFQICCVAHSDITFSKVGNVKTSLSALKGHQAAPA